MRTKIAVPMLAMALGAVMSTAPDPQTVWDPFWVQGPRPTVGVSQSEAGTGNPQVVEGEVLQSSSRGGWVDVYDFETGQPFRLQLGAAGGSGKGTNPLRRGAVVRVPFSLKNGHMVATDLQPVRPAAR